MTQLTALWIYYYASLELLLATLTAAHRPISAYAHKEQVCNPSVFRTECPVGDVIVLQSALYGRMTRGECVKIDLGYIGCQTNILLQADRLCGGKPKCSIPIPNPEFEEVNTCLGELKSYMEISYSCQYVLPESETCDNKNDMNVTLTSGYISSHVTGNGSCGTKDKPWIIKAKSGQMINLTLIDFSLHLSDRNYETGGDSRPQMCHHYGSVKDINEKQEWDICGGQMRESLVYKSIGNQIQVTLSQDDVTPQPSFLLYFEILGCPDETPQEGMWYRRVDKELATIGCIHHDTKYTWNLYCENNMWKGHRGNCSGPLANRVNVDDDDNGHGGFGYGLAIAIIIGAAIGVGSVIVIVGILRYRRYNSYSRANSGPAYSTNTMLLRPTRQSDEYQLRCTCPVPPPQQKMHERTMRPQRAPPDTRTATLHRSPQVPRHYSLSQTVQVNGNEYEHIWQTPLPKPRAVSTDTAPSTEEESDRLSSGKDEGGGVGDGSSGEYTKYHTDNKTNEDKDRPYYIRSKDIYNGSKDDCRTSEGYSTLRKNTPPNTDVITNCPADV